MFEKTKVKMAARNVKNSKRATVNRRNTRRNRRSSFWGRVWNIICWPFRQIAKLRQVPYPCFQPFPTELQDLLGKRFAK